MIIIKNKRFFKKHRKIKLSEEQTYLLFQEAQDIKTHVYNS